MKWPVTFYTSDLYTNYHGPDGSTLRSTWQIIVRMGCYAKCWSLYVYRADGSSRAYRITFPYWKGPWPNSVGSEPHRRDK